MRSISELLRPRAVTAGAGVLALLVVLTLLVPGARGPLVAVVPWCATALLVVLTVARRPVGRGVWVLLTAMVGLWSASYALGQLGAPSTAVHLAGQLAAVGAIVAIVRRSTRHRRGVDLLELWVVASVLTLAAAQSAMLVASAVPGAAMGLLAVVDVVLVAFVLRFSLVRRTRLVSWWCGVGAATLVATCDVVVRDGGPADAGGLVPTALVLGYGLWGLAALHPSMRVVFERRAMSGGRHRSADVLGLLPLVLVPVGLRVVDVAVVGDGLPRWSYLAAGTSIAVAGVLRAWSALRGSEHLAEHDPLTDLPNRRGLARLFEEAPGEGWALLLVDLDDFKDVNDAHGHDVGDALLLGVRDRLVVSAGRDGVVARFGGDEFVVLVRSGREEVVADRLLLDLRPPMLVRGLALRTSGSVGLAPADAAAGLSELLTRADVALYAAKGAGRDTVRAYHPEQRAEVQRRFTLTSQVRQLLGGRSASVGRLEVHYQPLVELASGEVVGAEALVRWRHPEHGLLPPDAFLGHVTSSGLDAELDTAVLHEVLEQMGRWRDQRRTSLPVSVNLTRTSLLDPALADRVREALARAGVPGDQLHVEITEHEPLPDDDRLLAALHSLRGLGVEIHLDDYGTGYTSLDYLRRFPVRVLKVDRSLVAGIGAGGGQLVAGLGAMSRTLRLDLLAEGVETEEQRRRLLAQGVRLGQGWLFSHPLPAPVYAERVLGRPHECLPLAGVPAPRLPLATPADVV